MNVKFGTDNFSVRYLKRFLNTELSQSNSILGEFDKNDLQLLINYLNLPNVKNMFEVQKEVLQKFPELHAFFTMHLKDNVIQFISREISQEVSEYIVENLDAIKEYCSSVAWEVSDIIEWVDLSKDINGDGKIDQSDRQLLYDIVYNNRKEAEAIMKKADINLDGVINELDLLEFDNYLNNNRLLIEIKQSNRTNYFPNQDMLVFINQFTGMFLYNYAIRDNSPGYRDDMPHPSIENYKIALYECKPGQKITIAHNNGNTVPLIIGCSTARLKQDIPSMLLQNIVEVNLRGGDYFEYTCSKNEDGTGYDAHWLCIQCPSDYGYLSQDQKVETLIRVGDINGDGEVNLQDYHMLANYTATGPDTEHLHWKATARQKVAMDINKDGKIDNADTLMFEDYLNNKISDLGLAVYDYIIPAEIDASLNIDNFLIIDGHYDKSVNIPFSDFVQEDWIIHEKFFSYLFGMCIHKYSPSTDISYLQQLLKEFYPEYMYDTTFFYPGVYSDNMRLLVRAYQLSKIYYYKGDLNNDNLIDKVDLQLLRDYLDDPGHKAWVEDPSKNSDSELLTPIQKDKADVNYDFKTDEEDYKLLEKVVNNDTNAIDLKNYYMTFNIGWYDPQVEDYFENDVNISGNISEVTK